MDLRPCPVAWASSRHEDVERTRRRVVGRTARRLWIACGATTTRDVGGAEGGLRRGSRSQRRSVHRLLPVCEWRLAQGEPDPGVDAALEPSLGGGRDGEGSLE